MFTLARSAIGIEINFSRCPLRSAQADPRAGVRHHQIGDGIPTIPAARARLRPRRVEPGYYGLEHQADACAQPRLSAFDAWIAARCLDTSRQRQSAIVAMFSANLIAQSAADVWHIEINPESDRLLGDW